MDILFLLDKSPPLPPICEVTFKTFLSRFYGWDIRASAILFGDIPPPIQAQDLYDVLESFTLKYETEERRSYARATKESKKVCIALLHTCFFLHQNILFLL